MPHSFRCVQHSLIILALSPRAIAHGTRVGTQRPGPQSRPTAPLPPPTTDMQESENPAVPRDEEGRHPQYGPWNAGVRSLTTHPLCSHWSAPPAPGERPTALRNHTDPSQALLARRPDLPATRPSECSKPADLSFHCQLRKDHPAPHVWHFQPRTLLCRAQSSEAFVSLSDEGRTTSRNGDLTESETLSTQQGGDPEPLAAVRATTASGVRSAARKLGP